MRLKFVMLNHFRGYRASNVIPVDEAITGTVSRHNGDKRFCGID